MECVLLCQNNRIKKFAFDLYLTGQDLIAISDRLNCDVDELRHYAFGEAGDGKSPTCWEYYRKNVDLVAYKSVILDRKEQVAKILDITDKIIARELVKIHTKVITKGERLPVDELEKISKINERFDKMNRLENGKPTDVVKSLELSPEQQAEIAKIMDDPFSKAVDVESRELDG